MLILLRSIFYTPDASFILEFFLALLMLALVRFSYSADSSFSEEFLLHSS